MDQATWNSMSTAQRESVRDNSNLSLQLIGLEGKRVEVAIVHRRLDDDDALIKRHADLFVAAPDLLDAAKEALNSLELNHHLVTNAEERMTSVRGMSALIKAIAKAKGEE